jgi:PAS domain S-box-containing protein
VPRVIDLLVVRTDPCTVSGALLESDSFEGRVRAPDAAAAAFEAAPPDCVVACFATLPATLAALASDQSVPVVDCREKDSDALATRIRAAVAGGERERGRIARLHESAAELVAIDDQERLYDRAVELAGDVLDFDIAVVFLREPDGFHRVATTDDAVAEYREPDHGVIAQVNDRGEPALVDDIHDHETAHSHSPEYRSGVAVPFGEVGVFVGLSTAVAAFDETDLELAELLSSHAAQVEARLRAEADLRERQHIITELHEAAPSLIDAETERELFERVVDIAERVLEFDHSSVFVSESEGFRIAATCGKTPERIPSADSILYRTHEQGRPFLVADVTTTVEASPAYNNVQSGLSVPVGEDAVFQAVSTEVDAFDETDLELAELLTAYAGSTLSRIRSERALRESRRVIERLHAAAADVAAAETEDAVLDRAIDAAEEVLAFEKCAIILREGDELVPAAESSQSPENAARPMELSEGVVGKTYQTKNTYRLDELVDDGDAEPAKESYRSAISVPIGDLGVFQAVAAVPAAFDGDDVHLAELLMAHVAVSLERVRAEADLRAQRDRLEALFENVPGAAISYEIVDGEPVIRRVNSAFEETFGYDAETIVDEPLDQFIVPAAAKAKADEYNERLEAGERIQTEVKRDTAEGSRHFLLQVIPLSVGAENSRGYAIYIDVTEQREREVALRRQNERLDQFASVVSHDLRNPLNVASGYLELARESGDDCQLDRVATALGRMDALVEDLLRLAREGRDVGETEPAELASLAEAAWNHVQTEDATLQVEVERTVQADRDRLTELFENLYRNAIEHAGDASTVTVSDIEDEGRWQGFAVADDGPGIDPDIEPFETGSTTSTEGTGFGLAIVKSIAAAHGWSVAAAESETGGARFEFRV